LWRAVLSPADGPCAAGRAARRADACAGAAGVARMIELRKSTPADTAQVMEVWRRAVDATHHFLSPGDRREIDAEVAAFLPGAALDLAVEDTGRVVAFMLLEGNRMEALFVDPDYHRCGIGRRLVEEALRRHPDLATDVNEQNAAAMAFY